MTAYTRSKLGVPESGRFSVGDTVTDAANVVWVCVRAGMSSGDPSAPGFANFTASPVVDAFAATPGAASVATVTAAEAFSGVVHKTVLTLAALPVAVADATQYGGTKIYDFPEGRILVLGTVAQIAPTTTTAIASTINSGVAGTWALGRATASNVSLTGTMVDLLPSTAFTSSTTINVAAATVTGALAAAAQFDGTATAIDMYLNNVITTATDIDADGTIAWTGTITCHWINLGDY